LSTRYRNSSWRSFDPDAPRAGESTVVPVPLRCRVLGLDPGSLRTGYGLIDCDGPTQRYLAAGVIRTQGETLAERLRHIYVSLTQIIETHRPDEIAIERVFVHRNPDSALKLGQARGVAMCAASLLGAPVFEYAPRAIKLALVGTGNAEKLQVAHMVKAILAIDTALGLDASDALAVGLCHGQSRRLNLLMAGAAGNVPA
jgi:crossover junction endodeoxyribonuclease RuvC